MIERNWEDEAGVLIVSGPKNEEIAIKYGLYVCKNKKSFKPSRYIAFYVGGFIRHFAKILSVFDDVNLAEVYK